MRLPLILILVSIQFHCAKGNFTKTGVDHQLKCVNDYVFTINCSLSFKLTDALGNDVSWLGFNSRIEKRKYKCMLSRTSSYYFCSFDVSLQNSDENEEPETFNDVESFDINLHRGDHTEIMIEKYIPKNNIKPKTPYNLEVNKNFSQYHFTWKSGYEKHLPWFYLIDHLIFELCYHRTGQLDNATFHLLAMENKMSGNDLIADTEYTVRVRSSPNQGHYKGEWSEWSSAVHWRTDKDKEIPPDIPFHDWKLVVSLCVLIPLLIFLVCIPIRLRKHIFIPTPEPYFQSLYSDCHGDFKSWVVTQNHVEDMLKTEETLQIDTLTETLPIVDQDSSRSHVAMDEGPSISPISDPAIDASMLGVPYAVTSRTSFAHRDPINSLSICSEPGSPIEEDSGCWFSSAMSLERESPWHKNEYCTLSVTFRELQKTDEISGDQFSGGSCEVISDQHYHNKFLGQNC